MRQDQIWDAETAQRYDTPGTGMFAPEVLGPTVDKLAALAGGGRALELAIGTGRVAIPLHERGVPVTGIELSQPMIDQLRTKSNWRITPFENAGGLTHWDDPNGVISQISKIVG